MEEVKEGLIIVETKNKKEKNETLKKLLKVFWIFIIGSVLGYIVEMIVGFVQNGHFVTRQGLVLGPFIQVYGIGLVVYYLIVPNAKTNLQTFVISMILGGVVEYIFSYFQERYFGTVSWDYSNLPFNVNGRTSLLHCIYWGIGGVMFMRFIYPNVQKIDKLYKNKYFKIVTILLVIFIAFDIAISSMAVYRKKERKMNIKAETKMDILLDKYYPDEKLEEIYSNAKER